MSGASSATARSEPIARRCGSDVMPRSSRPRGRPATGTPALTIRSRTHDNGMRAGLAAGEGPASDGVDAGADLAGGRLRQRRAAAGAAQFGVDDPVRLAGPVAPGADQAVEFLPERGEGLTAHGGCGGSGLRV